MSNVIYKDNNLIEASYALNLSEQRLILIAILAAREIEKELTAETMLTIHASEYMKQFKLGRQSAYEALQAACDNLFERRLTYKTIDPVTGKKAVYKSRWVSKVGYVKEAACVQLIFAPDILPLFIKLEEKFTRYELKQISQLTSVYSIRLYELLIRWRSTGKLYVPIADLREKLGLLEDEYSQMGDFKKRVLKVAIEQINKFTDIEVTFFEKDTVLILSDRAPENLYKLTAKQISYFAQKLCDIDDNPDFGRAFGKIGETQEDFQERIEAELTDQENVKKYFSHLLNVGYKPKNGKQK